MLKTIVLPERSTSEKLEVGDGKMNEFGISDDGVKHFKKSEKSKA